MADRNNSTKSRTHVRHFFLGKQKRLSNMSILHMNSPSLHRRYPIGQLGGMRVAYVSVFGGNGGAEEVTHCCILFVVFGVFEWVCRGLYHSCALCPVCASCASLCLPFCLIQRPTRRPSPVTTIPTSIGFFAFRRELQLPL